MKTMRTTWMRTPHGWMLAGILGLVSAVGLAGCGGGDDDPADMMEEAGDAVEDTADDVQDAAEDAADDLEDAAEEAGDEMRG